MEKEKEIKSEYPIYKGVLYNCCYCNTNFISIDFLQKHQLKCQYLIIHSILKEKLTLKKKKEKKENSLKSMNTMGLYPRGRRLFHESSDHDIFVPQIILGKTSQVEYIYNLLSEKSKLAYEKEYTIFCQWRILKNIKDISEEVLLAYFWEKSKRVKASTLWSYYSKLKATLSVKENIDISKFSKLRAQLKRQTTEYIPKKSKIFEKVDIMKFLESPDEQYLFMKVVAIMGIAGGCRIDELHKMKVDDIEDKGSILVVDVPDSKTKTTRTFTVIGEGCELNPIKIFRKYLSLRPLNVPHKNLFICYRAQKCTVQPVGINSLAKVPKFIAEYLELPSPESYTGHCFRLSSAKFVGQCWS